ncbi:MAG: hypothetical protein BGN86_01575 [Caulobacterales bacterium 68-7]|nr:MAG: hypothetical protein BGN86_01575 [Caulobacterales bacterium 68-7]
MAAGNHIENPFEYFIHGLSDAFAHVGRPRDDAAQAAARVEPQVRRLEVSDLRSALKMGLADFGAARDDVVFLAVIYPLAGLMLAALAMQMALLPLILPMLTGFAIVGPLAAVGLYEISRRREAGEEVNWADAAHVFRSPALGSIMAMGLVLIALFVAWVAVAYALGVAAFATEAPATAGSFLRQMFATGEGGRMVAIGVAVGFVFALAAFVVSAVSFPLLVDRHVDMDVAIRTSIRVVAENPGVMAMWALIVAATLAIGALPALLGLIVVVPVLGPATWHLYRKAVV